MRLFSLDEGLVEGLFIRTSRASILGVSRRGLGGCGRLSHSDCRKNERLPKEIPSEGADVKPGRGRTPRNEVDGEDESVSMYAGRFR